MYNSPINFVTHFIGLIINEAEYAAYLTSRRKNHAVELKPCGHCILNNYPAKSRGITPDTA